MKRLWVILLVMIMILGGVATIHAIPFNGHDYQLVNFTDDASSLEKTWLAANIDMVSKLGSHYHLATITSQGEQDFIASLIGDTSGEWWLGGYQPIGADEPAGDWTWVNDEGVFWDNGPVPGMYANWNDGEPNENTWWGEDRLAIWGQNAAWQWNDEGRIRNISGYIAESKSAPVPEPATMLLLGTGLIGLAGLGRKKLIKK